MYASTIAQVGLNISLFIWYMKIHKEDDIVLWVIQVYLLQEVLTTQK